MIRQASMAQLYVVRKTRHENCAEVSDKVKQVTAKAVTHVVCPTPVTGLMMLECTVLCSGNC